MKTKEMFYKTFKTLELWFPWSLFSALGRHKPRAGGFCLDLSLIIQGVSSKTVEKPRAIAFGYKA
jgi:hypothetical protein